MRDKYTQVGSEPTFYSGLDDVSGMTPNEKVDWFKGRFSKIVVGPLDEVRKLGNTNQRIWDLNLGVVTIICSAIEALSSFYAPGTGTDKQKFVSFVEEFMDPVYRTTSPGAEKKHSEILYTKFRCGLAHGMSIEGHEVASRPQQYLSDDNGYVSIDLWGLFEDLKKAFDAYINRVSADEEAKEAFLRRFREVFEEPYDLPKA